MRVGTYGNDAVLEVADQGLGMSQEEALWLFERFYCTDSSRIRASGCIGLRLSIAPTVV